LEKKDGRSRPEREKKEADTGFFSLFTRGGGGGGGGGPTRPPLYEGMFQIFVYTMEDKEEEPCNSRTGPCAQLLCFFFVTEVLNLSSTHTMG